MNLDRLKREREQMIRDFTRYPSCIIIHTGTNDLHSLCNNSSDAVRKMAEITSKMFPESRIIISTHLPSPDTPPHHLQHQCCNFLWLFCATQCTPGPPPPHRPSILTSPTQRWSLYFCKDPKRCSLRWQNSITETPVTNSTIPLAYSPLHAKTSPSGPGEDRHRLDKHHTSSTTPTKGSLHTCKPAVTDFTSTCCPSNPRKKEETKTHPTSREAPTAESTEQCWSCSQHVPIREMLQTLCNQLLNR